MATLTPKRRAFTSFLSCMCRHLLAGGATLRAYRGRGAQLALLRVRCQEALDSGCELIVSETGAPLPGDPQHSHRNLERCGLRVIGTRLNYAPEGMQWDHGVQT